MNTDIKLLDGACVVSPTGEIDHHRAKGMINDVSAYIERELPLVVRLDMAGVSFTDSSGIALALCCLRRVNAYGGAFSIINPCAQPAKVFRAAGLGKYINNVGESE